VGPLYIVTERFDPSYGEVWDRYLSWSGLRQLTELVSLDPILCQPVVKEILPDDWPYIVNEDFMLDFFVDLDYLLRRAGSVTDKNLLCVFRNPSAHASPPANEHRFLFEGYDLVDIEMAASALSNCGGFSLAFSNEELSAHGLLPSLERANEVKRQLVRYYPDEHHAQCNVWAVFRAIDV